ncbi:MAG: NFACT RNA binding domain-containing protein [Candidatus ainarchaeum sp.]|nr:NFACT RNA binding domain-containing protein [Candidatus ainarchaeum sp.]
MEIELDVNKSLEENAARFFEESKKAKKKLKGLLPAIEETRKKIANIEKESEKKESTMPLKKRKRAWFESFHWFFSSDGFLVIAGRSAKENEEAVKKHLEEGDIFLHADIQGGAATIIKAEGKKIPETTMLEAANFAGVFSKAWQSGIPSVEVYAVGKEQVSKKAPSGEALSTGGFMIYGKRQWFKAEMRLAIGLKQEAERFVVISGPLSAVKKQAPAVIELKQGSLKSSEAAKKILKIFSGQLKREAPVAIDEIIRMIPGANIGF